MTVATKARPRKPAERGPEQTLHVVLGALETAGKRVARFAHDADAKLVSRTKKGTQRKTS